MKEIEVLWFLNSYRHFHKQVWTLWCPNKILVSKKFSGKHNGIPVIGISVLTTEMTRIWFSDLPAESTDLHFAVIVCIHFSLI